MERIFSFLRNEPYLLALGGIVVFTIGISAILGFAMSRGGVSLRPLIFFDVFLGIIVAPQLILYVLQARGIVPQLVWTPTVSSPQWSERGVITETAEAKFLHPAEVFGAGYDRDLVSDVRRLFESLNPETAQMAIFRDGESTIAARFASSEVAYQARRTYAAMVGHPRIKPSPDGKLDLMRAGGDMARLFVAGKMLFVWTGANVAALDRRMAGSASSWQESAAAVAIAKDPRVARWWKIMAFSVPLLMGVAAVWFFKGSTWATSVSPKNVQFIPTTADELRDRLLSIEKMAQPITVTAGSERNQLVVTWRADAAWLNLARAGGLRRTQKLVLYLSEKERVVRVREYWSRLDWAAGEGGANLAWKMGTGVNFFQVEHERVFGLQLDPETGRFKPQLNYAYTYNAQELKAPLIAATTNAGWIWRPVNWNGPAWLRWLTE